MNAEHYEALEAAGLCVICERRRDLDDGICVECRQDIAASSSTVVDPVEVALNDHWQMTLLCREGFTMCRCGWSIDSGPGYHRRHMAEMIYEALGPPGPFPWDDGPLVEHPQAREPTSRGHGGWWARWARWWAP